MDGLAAVGSTPVRSDAGAAAIDIRHLRTHEEFVACVDLQMATWGEGFREVVPTTILKVSQRLGGVTAGAFTAQGELVGFVFGMTGVERGRIVHWSDMLAVRGDFQDHGVGRRLKEFQREAVRALGVSRMYWTYDPLVARNAHFNLNRLGARVAEYVPDMYGSDTGSSLHQGFGTDRFIVRWEVSDRQPSESGAAAAEGAAVEAVLNPDGREMKSAIEDLRADARPGIVHVEIPLDIFGVQSKSAPDAARWRASSRRAFQWALANGYTVDRFQRDAARGRAFYRLSLSSDGA